MASLALARLRLLAEDATRVPLPRITRPRRVLPRPGAKPVTDGSVHPGATGLALAGYGLFLAASWAGWAFGYAALLTGVIFFLSAMYFGLLIGGGMIAGATKRIAASASSWTGGFRR